mmetsp:Transcript_23922/g.40392  ORF Transcript_23922/g.40392 Transcript_23922/m.40392 type:complete len:1796 (-) Transcript_23922:370-5757(-)
MRRIEQIAVWVLCLGAIASLTDAASNGKLGSGAPYCFDAMADIGCDPRDWHKGDFLDCRQNVILSMNWAGRPKYSSMYTLRLKDTGRTSYVPQEWITVVLEVNRYPFKYRGLVLHASSSSSRHVGQWQTTGNDAENREFWNPTVGKECIMHAQADLKPLQVEFRFKAPPAGTGTITFHALIKIGPANTGYFYYPNGVEPNIRKAIPTGDFPGTGTDLQLTEASPPSSSPSPSWGVAPLGVSCSEFCASMAGGSKVCDGAALRAAAVNTPNGMESTLASISGCPLPYKPSCASVAPAMDNTGACFYNGISSSLSPSSSPKSLCVSAPGASYRLEASCYSSHPSARRFCPCKESQAANLQAAPSSVNKESTEPAAGAAASKTAGIPDSSNRHSQADSVPVKASAAFAPAILFAVMGLLGARGGALFRGASPALTAATAFLLQARPAAAHNWLRSPGRAMFEASTTNPFRQRRSTDVHAQLGPGQEMAVKWATGHGRDTYFVIINGDDEDYIWQNEYKDWVKDYVDSAPASANQAATKPRLHWCRDGAACQNTAYFTGAVQPTDADFCDHTKYPSGTLHRWKSNLRQEDRYVIYDNPKYPWIIGAMRYPHIAHMPRDADIICMPVPRRQGTNAHHIVHWFWNGYYDAVDVHAHFSQVPQELIYGNDTGTYEINRIDHCQFVQPAGIATGIYPATDNVSTCLNQLEIAGRGEALGNLGLNVVPLAHSPAPASLASVNDVRAIPFSPVTEPDVTGLRWPRDYIGVGLSSPYMKHTGTETSSTYNWTRFVNSAKAVRADTRCNRGPTFSNFIDALDECIHGDCWAIAWQHNGADISTLSKGSGKTVRVCRKSNTNLIATTGWTLYEKPDDPPSPSVSAPAGYTNPATWTDSNHYRTKISFQPENPVYNGNPFTINLGTGWNIDSGKTFGDRGNGLSYGWKCAINMAIQTNRPTIDTSNTGVLTGKAPKGSWRTKCPGGAMNEWEIAVANGVYVVTIYTGGFDGLYRGVGCAMESAKFLRNQNDEMYTTKYITVEVNDGRLTLTSLGGTVRDRYTTGSEEELLCPDIHWIQIDRLQDSYPEAWAPKAMDTKAAWWQLELDDQNSGVGYVSIDLPRTNSYSTAKFPDETSGATFQPRCTHWWFFTAKQKCYKPNRLHVLSNKNTGYFSIFDLYQQSLNGLPANTFSPTGPAIAWGPFKGSDEGVVVALSDVACTDNQCRSADEDVCEVVTRPQNCESKNRRRGEMLCPILVNCAGKKGRFLRLRARGNGGRYLAFKKISVARSEAKHTAIASSAPKSKRPMVCYGVEARAATITDPEFLTTNDAKDPIFYSTCYVRSRVISWLPISTPAVPKPRWSFNDACLDCGSFEANKARSPAETPHWWLSNACKSCVGTTPAWGEANLDPLTSTPTRRPSPGPTPFPTPMPSPGPTPRPTPRPTPFPTPRPSPGPTPRPTPRPSPGPTPRPTPSPSPGSDTSEPTARPTTSISTRPTPRPSPAPAPTPRPSRAPTTAPTARKQYRLRVRVTGSFDSVNNQFRRRFKRRLADMLGVEESSFVVVFSPGSIVVEITFVDNSGESLASQVATTPVQNLTRALNLTVESVSSPTLIDIGDESKEDSEKVDDSDYSQVAIVVIAAVGSVIILIGCGWNLYRRNIAAETKTSKQFLAGRVTVQGQLSNDKQAVVKIMNEACGPSGGETQTSSNEGAVGVPPIGRMGTLGVTDDVMLGNTQEFSPRSISASPRSTSPNAREGKTNGCMTPGQITSTRAAERSNGWTEYEDEVTGQAYWHNANTGESTWENPLRHHI